MGWVFVGGLGVPETGVVFEDVVAVELVAGEGMSIGDDSWSRAGLDHLQREPGGIGVRVGRQGHLEHRLRQ